ncbi:MAG: DUF86 domain-containing protein [Deltaproteobacteria bacterium]|nr:DUF86 domain-containing protein [Deltaproteobacteria bacterium]
MTPVEEGIIRRKLATMVHGLKAMDSRMTSEGYAGDIYMRKAAERLMQELTWAAIDINTHIIVHTDNAPPDDYFESFTRLGELKVIPKGLAQRLAAGLRNRLVHEYDAIEDRIVLEAIGMAQELYPEYIKEIEGFISGEG